MHLKRLLALYCASLKTVSSILGCSLLIFLVGCQSARFYPKITKLPENNSQAPQLSSHSWNDKLLNAKTPTSLTFQKELVTRPDEDFNFPIQFGEIGPVDSLFSGPLQYPFYCRTYDSGLGQPLVDNYEGFGIPVYEGSPSKDSRVIGYSKDCSIQTQVIYFYKSQESGKFLRWKNSGEKIESISLNGKAVPFIVRIEVGTINRFIYTLMSLKGAKDTAEQVDKTHWNNKLVYYFGGGVGIGYDQGKIRFNRLLERLEAPLSSGYAVAHSTGNDTSTHFDIVLSEDTALRVKRQFVSRYGEPEYTVGMGASGGAIQQYLLAQNRPGFLDGAITIYSYPDMITQTTYALDCDLLEYYFDEQDKDSELWSDMRNRQWILGTSANNNASNRFYQLDILAHVASLRWPNWRTEGITECAKHWRVVSQLVHNPRALRYEDLYSKNVLNSVEWSFWGNLSHRLGQRASGLGKQTWDNVGVQYGLKALVDGRISPEQFLDLNTKVGSWLPPEEMKSVRYWLYAGNEKASKFSMWSHHNMQLAKRSKERVAPRLSGDIDAMKAAIREGYVFLGDIDIPVLDFRHYLEKKVDMHHMSASFSSRLRIQKAKGHYNNQVIWVSNESGFPVARMLSSMDKWIKAKRRGGRVEKPVLDACFNKKGELIAEGNNVWNGSWNGKKTGQCSSIFKMNSTSRVVAGDSLAGYTFKCQLQSVEQAINRGIYRGINMKNYQAQLEKVFPMGVCDYGSTEFYPIEQAKPMLTSKPKNMTP
ncbi:DUF6351 family protein [Pleionea sediminis]|uniref:DUF6351 family protein n=1 Tax=Pleionea sediminis TaxID=2569479 RepID=UPI00118544E0|nr:DUF6351 family protein [Pleionea sediminis]